MMKTNKPAVTANNDDDNHITVDADNRLTAGEINENKNRCFPYSIEI